MTALLAVNTGPLTRNVSDTSFVTVPGMSQVVTVLATSRVIVSATVGLRLLPGIIPENDGGQFEIALFVDGVQDVTIIITLVNNFNAIPASSTASLIANPTLAVGSRTLTIRARSTNADSANTGAAISAASGSRQGRMIVTVFD